MACCKSFVSLLTTNGAVEVEKAAVAVAEDEVAGKDEATLEPDRSGEEVDRREGDNG